MAVNDLIMSEQMPHVTDSEICGKFVIHANCKQKLALTLSGYKVQKL